MNKQNNRMHVPVTEAFAGSDMFCSQRSSRAPSDKNTRLQRGACFYPSAVDQSFNLFNGPKSELMVHVISV